MARSKQNLESIVRQDRFDGAIFNLIDDGDPAQPIDLTGVTAIMQVRQNLIDRTLPALLELTTPEATLGGLVISDAANGQIQIQLINSVNIPSGGYFYDIQITFPDGSILTPIFGQWQILEEVTFVTETVT
jgi:hypothetical protein